MTYRIAWRSDWPPKDRRAAAERYSTKEPEFPRSFQAHLDRTWIRWTKVPQWQPAKNS